MSVDEIEQAVQQLSQPDLAAFRAWFAEYESQCWDETFARSQDQLAKLAEATRADIRAGRVHDLGMDELTTDH
jgi:hypothetical protein